MFEILKNHHIEKDDKDQESIFDNEKRKPSSA